MTDAQKQRTGFWLLPMWAGKDRDRFAEAMKRVAGEITTTFATSYSKRGGCPGFSAAALGWLLSAGCSRLSKKVLCAAAEVGMEQAVTVEALQVYAKQETGKKYLLNPSATALAKL